MAERRRGPDRRAKPSPGRRGRPPLSDGESVSLHVRVPQDLYDEAYAAATRDGISVPAIVRDALTRWLTGSAPDIS